jgi:hypothetical protein
MQQDKVPTMPDRDFLKPTWHVYDGCVLKFFFRHDEMFAIEFTPDQATKLATDLLISAQQARRQKPA